MTSTSGLFKSSSRDVRIFIANTQKNMRSGRNRKRNLVEISFLVEDECVIRENFSLPRIAWFLALNWIYRQKKERLDTNWHVAYTFCEQKTLFFSNLTCMCGLSGFNSIKVDGLRIKSVKIALDKTFLIYFIKILAITHALIS